MGGAVSCANNEFFDQVNRLGVDFTSEIGSESFQFLNELWKKAPDALKRLLTKLEERPIVIQAVHVDKIVALLNQQMVFPDTMLMSLEDYLGRHAINMDLITNFLLHTHAQDLLASATTRHLIHHSLPHALEMSKRLCQVMDNFGILTDEDPANRFLRAIIILMVQFHDLVQKSLDEKKLDRESKGQHKSAEEDSAERITGWIVDCLAIPDGSNLKKLINYIADYAIVLGTTTILSATGAMDLSELYLEFKKVALIAGILLPFQDSRAQWLQSLESIMLITGVCDKNPAAIYDLVALQANDPEMATLPLIKHHFQTPLVLDEFLESDTFLNPFSFDAPDSIQHQAFLMTLIPHVCMRAELSVQCGHQDAIQFIQLVGVCRDGFNYGTVDYKVFGDWFRFKVESHSHNMNRIVSEFFFCNIGSEISFCKSQTPGLDFTVRALMPMRCLRNASASAQPFIDSQVPMRDAENLLAFKTFYDGLNVLEQALLVSEIIFAVVIQAGQIHAMKSGFDKAALEQPVRRPLFFSPRPVSQKTSTAPLVPESNIDGLAFFAPIAQSKKTSSSLITYDMAHRIRPHSPVPFDDDQSSEDMLVTAWNQASVFFK